MENNDAKPHGCICAKVYHVCALSPEKGSQYRVPIEKEVRKLKVGRQENHAHLCEEVVVVGLEVDAHGHGGLCGVIDNSLHGKSRGWTNEEISGDKSPDLCSMRSINLSGKYLFDKESVWIYKAKSDYNVKLKVEEWFSTHIIFQHVLHKFGSMLG